jgi:type IV pilus assembly protein PilO
MARDSALSRLPLLGKIGIGAGLLALVGVAYFVVFYGEIASAIKASENRERTLRKDLADARKDEFAYQKDLADLTARQQRQRELNKILPATTEYPAFLSSIQNVANVAGVSLTAWTPQDEVPERFYSRVPMKLEFQGRFHQIAKFFYGVGQLDRIINVENIAITEPKLREDEVWVQVEALATAFRAVEPSSDKRDKSAGGESGAKQRPVKGGKK